MLMHTKLQVWNVVQDSVAMTQTVKIMTSLEPSGWTSRKLQSSPDGKHCMYKTEQSLHRCRGFLVDISASVSELFCGLPGMLTDSID